MGTPGPDQGYALLLARELESKVRLGDGEHLEDVLSGAAAVGMKRAGLLGRAPLSEDVEAGLIIWGFLDRSPDPALVALRRGLFAEIHRAHQYDRRRRMVDAVPGEVLGQPLDDIGVAHAEDWRGLLDPDI